MNSNRSTNQHVNRSTDPEVVIRVENLSKRYLIGHQRQTAHDTFRDVLANGARNFGRKILHPFLSSTSQQVNKSTIEEFYALRDVSFEIKRGDRVGIIGRNGAGKSTLLKLLSRITEPTSGRITLDGRVASLLEVGTGFHPELTGRENIFLNGAVLGMTRAEIKKKFDEIVAFSEVERFLDTPVKRYSSGMYVRLAFAVAAHLEPEILIVDEVLAVGDAQFQKKCLGKMEEVGREGRTVLFVSHNLDAISRLCESAIYMKSGNLVAKGPTDSILEQYTLSSLNADHKSRVEFTCDTDSKPFAFRRASFLSDNKDVNLGKEYLKFCIEYDISVDNLNAVVAIRIDTAMGTPVMTLTDNDLNLNRFFKIKGNYRAICPIPVGLLAPGRYFITLSAADMKSTRYDYCERAISIEVSQNKKIVTTFHREGPVLVPVNWETSSIEQKHE